MSAGVVHSSPSMQTEPSTAVEDTEHRRCKAKPQGLCVSSPGVAGLVRPDSALDVAGHHAIEGPAGGSCRAVY